MIQIANTTPRKVFTATKATVMARAVSTLANSETSYLKSSTASFVHTRSANTKYSIRGAPDFTGLELNWDVWNVGRIHTWMFGNKVNELTLPSVYGRWVFTRTEPLIVGGYGIFSRVFKPKKSQKKFFNRYHANLSLQVTKTSVDYQLTAETLTIDGTVGCLCPWCGVFWQPLESNLHYSCAFCGIISVKPNQLGEVV